MDNVCSLCSKPADQLFETGEEGIFACFKCQPLVPEITIVDGNEDVDNTIEIETAATNENSGSKQKVAIQVECQELHCGLCDKSFPTPNQLQSHVRNHKAERKFVCTFCSKAFSQSNNLKAHLRIHTNERPFVCNECGKAFTQVTNLNNHFRLHTGERPYACDFPGCSKAYAQVTNLNQHRKRHLSGAPVDASYECKLCGQHFDQRNHLFLHRKQAHGESRGAKTIVGELSEHDPIAIHTCKICDRSFGSEKALIGHVKQEHLEAAEEAERKTFKCVFEQCGAALESEAAHSQHLLSAHQLRVTRAPARDAPARRGRPPKNKSQPLVRVLPIKSAVQAKSNSFELEVEVPSTFTLGETKVKIVSGNTHR